jgi:hypothetical protein
LGKDITPVILIGFWREIPEPGMGSASHEVEGVSRFRRAFWKIRRREIREWPDPHLLVDEEWDPGIRRQVIDHLEKGFSVAHYPGFSRCRICGAINGTTDVSDGLYLWPEGLAHYLEAHHVRLPATFVEHVLSFGSWRQTRASQDAGLRDLLDLEDGEMMTNRDAEFMRDLVIMEAEFRRRPRDGSWWTNSEGSWDA